MSNKKKIFILLPDGVGLRNFVFSDFPNIAKQKNIELIYWNGTNFDLSKLSLNSISLDGKAHFKTDLMKRARKEIEIKHFIKKFDNTIFNSYLFKNTIKDIKSLSKNLWVKGLINKYHKDLGKLREKIKNQERQTTYYKNCINQLKKESPNFIFCTNQRPVQAISPITAAQDLGIPTATFIFSWDNLPKATKVVETDYYFVWSKYMAKQLREYYPYINEKQIIVTGSPQFELHYNDKIKLNKTDFCSKYNLPVNKKYICFSGDDITTSPHDPEYLNDVCEAVMEMNKIEDEWRIIFRPCPVDFSKRFDNVLEKHKRLVYKLRPKWKKQGEIWNTILPTAEDQDLLYNTILHSKLVINLGSSMVFDAVCHNKPCAYINYNPDNTVLKKDVKTIYRYIHFQSMTSKDAVVWLNSKDEIIHKINECIENSEIYARNAKKWFNLICKSPQNLASERIIDEINSIIS